MTVQDAAVVARHQARPRSFLGIRYVIPADVPHSLVVLSAGEVIDVFTPPRDDYL